MKLLFTVFLLFIFKFGFAQANYNWEKYLTKFEVDGQNFKLSPDSLRVNNINFPDKGRMLPIKYHINKRSDGVVRWCLDIADTNRFALQRKKYSDSLLYAVHGALDRPIAGRSVQADTLEFIALIEQNRIYYKLSVSDSIIGGFPLKKKDTLHFEFVACEMLYPNFFDDAYLDRLKYYCYKEGQEIIENENHLIFCDVFKIKASPKSNINLLKPSEITVYINKKDLLPYRILFSKKKNVGKSLIREDLILFKLLSN